MNPATNQFMYMDIHRLIFLVNIFGFILDQRNIILSRVMDELITNILYKSCKNNILSTTSPFQMKDTKINYAIYICIPNILFASNA